MPLLSVVAATLAGIVTAKLNRKSQHEANRLTGTNQLTEGYAGLTDQLQEERDSAVRERNEEREAHKRDFTQLRKEFEEFRSVTNSRFSKFLSYIHQLRGQVQELGGTPLKWPEDLDK
jgi:ABC-type transport system involved in cytochrome bd biosynthesis fused ATPase/permease subunit